MVLLAFALAARAEMPLPSYRDHLVEEAWHEVDDLVEQGQYDEAIAKAQAFEDAVTPDARIEVLVGMAWSSKHEPKQAAAAYRKAVDLDPTLYGAWSELGFLALGDGDYDLARDAFQHVSDLDKTGDDAWIGPCRLAEIAAYQDRPDEFEKQAREALRRGFSFRFIEGQPNWRRFYADPVMHDSVEKLVTVYGDPSTLETLKQAPPLDGAVSR